VPGYDVAGTPQYPAAAAQPAPGLDQLAMLLQALRHHRIPPLPGPAAQPAAPQPIPVAAPAPHADGLGLLRLILTNPQFQHALQSTPAIGAAAARTVQLPVPSPSAPGQVRSVPIPMGAVMNAIFSLAGQSMTELNESTAEDEPEVPSYLVDDNGDFVVDPTSPDDRAALVTHLFRISDEAQRSGQYWQPDARLPEADEELDESELWARDAGFIK
jgi:hypothetical protein